MRDSRQRPNKQYELIQQADEFPFCFCTVQILKNEAKRAETGSRPSRSTPTIDSPQPLAADAQQSQLSPTGINHHFQYEIVRLLSISLFSQPVMRL